MGGRDGGWSGAPLSSDEPRSREGGAAGRHDDFDPFSSPGSSSLGDAFDDPSGGELPTLEIDDGALHAARAPTRPAQPVDRASGGEGEVDEEAEAPPLPQHEVAALADYGPAPGSLVGSIPYAVLVLTRRRALQRELSDLERLRVTARGDAAEALIELGRALHAQGASDALRPLAPLLADADGKAEAAGAKSRDLQASRQVADAQRASLTTKIEQAEKAAGPYRDRETKLATQMNVRDSDLRRAKARLQRVDIELRNLAAGGQGGDAARQQALEAERQARRADVDKARGHVEELAPRLAEARRELTVMLEALNDLESQRRAVDEAQSRTERVHLSHAGAVEKEYHEALRALGSAALERSIAAELAPEAARKAELMTTALRARAREIRLHEAALGAYDAKAFQKGAALLGVAAAAVVAMLLVVLVR